MTTPGERLKAARERFGFATAKDAALAMGVAIATYTQHEKAVKHLPARRAAEYAALFHVTPEFILYGRGDMPVRIPLFAASGQDTGRAVALPPPPSELTRALEADGIAHFGMVAIYDQPQTGRPPLDLDGRLCVVAYVDDVLVHEVRIVRRGSKPNRFHLIDTAGRAPLFDHAVLWIAPVLAMVPG